MASVLRSPTLDVEAAVIAYLRPLLPAGAVVATDVPKTTRGELSFPARMVRVTRTGGPAWSPAHDGPSMLVECWAAGGPQAWQLAASCRDAMLSLDNTLVGAVWLSHRAETSGPVNYPDPRTPNPRYQFVHQLTARAAG